MTDDFRAASAGLWTEPVAPLRRDARVAEAGLPSAAPIPRAAPKEPAVHRGRLIAGFAAVIVIGVASTTAGVLASGTAGPFTADATAGDRASAAFAEEGGAPGGFPDSTLLDAAGSTGAGADDPPTADSDSGTDADPQTPPSDGSHSGPSDPAQAAPDTGPGTSDPGPTEPGPQEPGPSEPGPSEPGPQEPGPEEPSPVPSQPAPQPTQPAPQPTTPPPAAPDSLRFLDLTPNYGLDLLGIRLLSSYTLTLAGEPGSRASVTYGSLSAGTVTFDTSGRASIKLGRSLLDLGLSNPTIRVAYSDGTAGGAIEARRDSI
ncbi:hypothetical protein ACFWHT_00640 [Microbacterium sp. NPDC058342]|uniref:hypothetical protein n=1 Tax=Microbacterium sp. NPDC058342 TaxID=3346454 RepID=UPI00365237E4